MKALILAAGYGTRLYPLTLNQPKALLKIGNRPIADYILDKIEKIYDISEVLIVTNQKFFSNFKEWTRTTKFKKHIKIINDKTLSDETRIGTIGDIDLVIKSEGLKDDLLVIAGDNLFDLDLTGFIRFAKSKIPAATVAIQIVSDPEAIKRFGVVVLDEKDKIIEFSEKPKEPKSNLAAMCIYYFPKDKLNLVSKYLKSDANKDAPGHYIEWLSKTDTVYGYKFEGEWFDIGDVESYKLADKVYAERKK